MSEYIHVKGRQALLERKDKLSALGKRIGVRDAGGQIEALLKDFSAVSKIPHLILPTGPSSGDFAVVLREYSVAGMPSGILFPVDHTGELTVLALKEDRVRAALGVLEYLRNRSVSVALLSLRDVDLATQQVPSELLLSRFAVQTRRVRRSMPLQATVDETLATLGTRTRRNLRYYARKAETQLAAVFHGDLSMSEQAFLALNRNGSHPFPEQVARRLYYLSREPNRFLAAVSINDCHYVSAIGGRRFEDETIIDWQINDKGWKKESISTVARYLCIQHEVQRGATLLSFEGGTPHSMQNSFVEEVITDIMAVRRPFSPRQVRRWIAATFPRGNFVAYLLNDGKDTWQ